MKHLTARIKEHGCTSMTDKELYEILTGDSQAAEAVVAYTKGNIRNLAGMRPTEVASIPKMTDNRTMRIVAAMELGRRKLCQESEKTVVKSSADIATYLRYKLSDYTHEVFYVMFLNRANRVIHGEIVSQGSITGTVADPRMILSIALNVKAVNIVLCHNHPSGSLKPSRADEQLTQKIKEAARYLDIVVLDHIIVAEDGYYSFADEGII
jgi:DNA repair protein RadC